MPQAFKLHYPNTRIIIDCTDMKTKMPNRIDNRVFMCSSYKPSYIFKVLIGVTPNGFIAFKSACYGGRVSDSCITVNSGILNLLEKDDVVLADKSFPGIKTVLKDNKNILLVMPPILHNHRFEVKETYNIAGVRIHVERCIQRIKVYKILQFLPRNLFKHVDDVVHIASVLTNFLPPIIKEEVR